MKTRMLFLLTIGLGLLGLPVLADDWPQWQGPQRDNKSQETGLLQRWPAKGPPLLWTCTDAGIGFSGPAVVGNRLYTMGADSQSESVYAVDLESGKKLWSTEVGRLYTNGYGDGPRGTPTVDGELIFALSAQGNLVCVERENGSRRWSVSLTGGEIGGGRPNWGYCESPLVDGDQVVCSPGGGKGTLAAFDKKTGKLLWRSKELTDPAGYSSIIVGEVGGLRQYIQTTMKGVAGVADRDRKLL